MAINIISEKYNGKNVLEANAGDWVDGEIEFAVTVEHYFEEFNQLFYRDATGSGGGVYELEISQGNWQDEGFLQGDDIEIEVLLTLSSGSTIVKYFGTIAYFTSSTKLVLENPLAASNPNYPIIPFNVPWSTIDFPNGSHIHNGNFYRYETGVVRKVSRPEQIDFTFNLTTNGSTALNSLIDGQVNRFKHILPSGSILSVYDMYQQNYHSGGWLKNVKIQQLEEGATRRFRITFKLFQWVIVQDGFNEPEHYDAANCVAPIANIKVYSKLGNPNGLLSKDTVNNQANTGGYDESYNGGANNFSVQSIEWRDSLGNLIDGLDYSGESTFKAVVETGGTQTLNHRYRLGLAWRPEDSDFYSDYNTNLGKNLMVNAPENLFIPDGNTDTNTYVGEDIFPTGSRWDFKDIKIEIVGTTIEVSGKVIPNQAATDLFDTILDGGRRSTLWLALGTDAKIVGSDRLLPDVNRVSLKLFDADNIDAPILGVQIPDVVTQQLLDHNLNLITDNSVDNTTTEDDVLYKSEFRLIDNQDYEGVRVELSAWNSVTGEDFTLEEFYFDFSNVVSQSGQLQPNITIPRNFNLPPSTDRNIISLKRKPALDVAGKYGLELCYGFLNDWRYWLNQGNVNNDFFDINEPNNGKNKNWQRFYSGDWLLRISYYTILDGVEDFNHYVYKIRPYEDDNDITTGVQFTVLSNGTNPNQLVANELIEIEVTFTWNNNFTNDWVEFTVEDYEGGNRWVMSSVLDQGNVSNNPLKPIAGQTKIDVSGTGTNILVCKALIDTSIIAANRVSLSYRVFSDPNDSGGFTVETKLKEDGTAKKKEDEVFKLIE